MVKSRHSFIRRVCIDNELLYCNMTNAAFLIACTILDVANFRWTSEWRWQNYAGTRLDEFDLALKLDEVHLFDDEDIPLTHGISGIGNDLGWRDCKCRYTRQIASGKDRYTNWEIIVFQNLDGTPLNMTTEFYAEKTWTIEAELMFCSTYFRVRKNRRWHQGHDDMLSTEGAHVSEEPATRIWRNCTYGSRLCLGCDWQF